MTTSRPRIWVAATLLCVAGMACTNLESATNLNPEGPPMIRQVRLTEHRRDASGSIQESAVFAFGTHDQAAMRDYPTLGANSMTTVAVVEQKFRIVVDELLVGNYIEEIACRAPVDDDAYDFVPLGTTPDDIAKCAVAKDVLPRSCPGSLEHAVCICKIEGGCGDTPQGGPVGILDVNQDGAADDTRMINGAFGIQCGDINVPLDLNNSYWNPSGDQNVPAMGGFDALGPAVVLRPTTNTTPPIPGVMPTNSRCHLTVAPDVVDKQNNGLCAPPEGDIDRSCASGDLSAFEFMTAALTVSLVSPMDGEAGVDRLSPVVISASAPLALGTLGAITMKVGTMAFTGFTVTAQDSKTIRLGWTSATGLAANTTYTITVSTALTDIYNQPLVTPVTWTFTTAP
jgi:hypothetical protein